MSVRSLGTAERLLHCGCIVGESLIWDDRTSRLVWIDMLGHKIHLFDPITQCHDTCDTPGMVTSIGMCGSGGYVVGLEKTVAVWRPGQEFETLATIEPDRPENRLNEGVVGPDGCFWVGTMQNNVGADGTPRDQTEATGQVWRIHPNGAAEQMLKAGFWLTNTIAWLGGRVVIGDTGRNTLFSFAQNTATGALDDKRVFLADYGSGLPDGSCTDQDSHLWNCRVVGGSEVLRLDNEGTPVARVATPCSWPTSCVIGGPQMDTLFVTSARFTMTDNHLTDAPWEGDLFSFKLTGIKGHLHHRFGEAQTGG
ncbi:SMP-30/gluconolactonase/LRE family protein [Pseudooctadecabacter jejudonensis]|uniref:L-arabinolactonase n=1 Tax=Pseudooctadecabacter jejudonensis TaxID=1391910 RepID=A0A1Y5TF96_9RHOB|nr:SMP-30/gluconolactonase/LRE family protein [Pseudooctadecabacter jejudonensis]SLN62581.1 L-arabinolactonase [Pseudooctadecabacter jejudonensis]